MSSIDIKHVHKHLSSIICRYLSNDLLKTALFYSERLVALDGSDHESRHLLAKTLLKLDQPHSALHLVSRAGDERCKECLVIAAGCNEQLLRFGKAREIMAEALRVPGTSTIPEDAKPLKIDGAREASLNTAALHCKAGRLAAKASQKQEAIDSFYAALSLDPLLWEAWVGITSLGASVEIDDILKIPMHLQSIPSAFTEEGEALSTLPALRHPSIIKISQHYATAPTPLSKPGPSGTGQGFFTPDHQTLAAPERFLLGKLPRFGSDAEGAPYVPGSTHTSRRPGGGAQQAGLGKHAGTRRLASVDESVGPSSKRARTGTGKKETRSGSVSTTASAATATRRSTRLLMSNGKGQLKHPTLAKQTRRTTRQRSQSISEEDNPSSALSPSSGSIAHSPRSDSTENLQAGSSQESKHNPAQLLAERYVFDLMRIFARAQGALSRYECRKALGWLERLPGRQVLSPSAMIMVAKAHYEVVEYIPAERAFQTARRLDPYRVWDMELYSTLLWHLRRNAQLSFLAQELLNINPKSAEAWIAVGNCFSLQKEHSQALVAFQRAAEMDPHCAYAYTLSGHEALVSEDVRRAIVLFQTALGYDGRLYNAWYGLGSCYLKTGRWAMAQYHFERAVEIHPANAVLLGCLGMVHERQGLRDDALSLFDIALETCPTNALVRYRRAKIMVQRGDYAAAERDLLQLCDLSPSEPNVVLLLGKVYRLQGKTQMAARVLAVARDLDPRNAPRIAKLIEETARRSSAAAAGRGTGNHVGLGAGETSIEDRSSAVDVSMEGSIEGT